METYIKLTMDASGEKLNKLTKVLGSMQEYELSACREFFKEIDPELVELFNEVEGMYGEYMEGIEDIKKRGNSVVASLVCGSGGLEYAASLLKLFGRYADNVKADFEHDEDGGGCVLTYNDGKVMMNGQEYQEYI